MTESTYNPVDRFAVFCGPMDYPSGGWHDFLSSHVTLDQAKDALLLHACGGNTVDWAHIYDLHDSRMVFDIKELMKP